ncbi:MAG: hypothetical protein K0Q73_1194 [Paenibacillus sp.]|jgi:ABC-type Fe3+-hydroxamate transport system substrate-binding protein|nr:hypothetical protein [Paenibacillus sp.]
MNQKKPGAIPFRDILFTMNGIQYRTLPVDGEPEEEVSDAHVLLLVTEGQGAIQANGVQFRLIRGDSLMIQPGTRIKIRFDGGERLRFYILTFDIYKVEERGGIDKAESYCVSGFPDYGELFVESFYRLEDFMKELYLHRSSLDEQEQFVNQFRFQQLIYFILEQKRYQEQKADPRLAVERTIQHLQHHYHETITVEQLAQMAGISRRWYTTLFKQLTGKNPIDYLNEIRIRRAKELLHFAENSLYDIARRVGFQDEHYFSRRFRQTVGMSPRIYVRNRRHFGTSVTYPELLHALGITPIAATSCHDDFPSYLKDSFQGVLKLVDGKTPNFEAIRSAMPDLIFAPAWRDEKSYDQLAKIAPTVLLPERDDWRDELRDMGKVLGRENQADKVIQHYEAKVADAREQLRTLFGDESVMYMRISDKEIIAFGELSSRGKMIHQELGLKSVEALSKIETGVVLSIETISVCNADHIFLHLDHKGEDVRKIYQQLLKSVQWNDLTAVKRNQVYLVGSKEWYNFSFSPVATIYAIDDILYVFKKKNE